MLVMSLLVLFLLVCAVVTLFISADLFKFLAWFGFSIAMVFIWYELSMPWVAVAQGIFGLIVTSVLIWCALHQIES